MTERLYYTDSYLQEFRARVTAHSEDGLRLYLDRTAFYPTSGGQPNDTGTIAGVPVVDVVDEGDQIAHITEAPAALAEGSEVECCIDWERRLDHMQQHSGQHLLSGVFVERFGLDTISFHLGRESSTIDLETLSLDAATLVGAESSANHAVFQNRPIHVNFEDAGEARNLRKSSERTGSLRIVSIDSLDRIACGGTHVRLTGEIGPILLRKVDKVRNTMRVEFLCGGRAVRQARSDYDVLARVAQMFSGGLEDVPELVSAQLEAARVNDKLRRKLESDLAEYRGREMYAATSPDEAGARHLVYRIANGSLENVRTLAQSFTAQSKAVFVGVLEDPPAVLLAISADLPYDAGKLLKSALAEAGGRGGGNQRLAQGSVPNREALELTIERIKRF